MRHLCLILAALVIAFQANTEPVRGTVYHDANANRTLDAGEAGIPGVAVSNGEAVVLTDTDGKYTLDVGDPGIVFVIKPSDWMVTPSADATFPPFHYLHRPQGSPPLKHGGLPPTGPLPEEINFPLQPQSIDGPVRILVLGDTQVRDFQEIHYFLRDMVTEIAGMDIAFGCTLGDNVFNNPKVFAPLRQAVAQTGLPWHFVPGNHDADFDAPAWQYSYETFQRELGPAWYAAAYGNVHVIVLEDIRYDLPSHDYHAELGKEQQSFIRNYLANVSPESFIVLLMHIPIMEIADRAELYDTIAAFPNCISLSAHTHSHAHYFLGAEDGWPGKEPHHHIVQGTACGSWYRGFPNAVGIPEAVMADGTPKGYSVLTIDGSEYDLAYQASGHPASYQMDIYAPARLKAGDGGERQIVTNFFNGTERCQVEMRLNDGPWTAMERFKGYAPYYTELQERRDRFVKLVAKGRGLQELDEDTIERIESQFRPAIGRGMPGAEETNHLWRAPVPDGLVPGFNRVEVRAKDMFGRDHEGDTYIYFE